jgi:hypothetical protein
MLLTPQSSELRAILRNKLFHVNKETGDRGQEIQSIMQATGRSLDATSFAMGSKKASEVFPEAWGRTSLCK